ncbi:MAG TPA: AAA family ATPase [Xanthobacteraceae bacterium]|nr:AAA family ATPase [Xanthobacteraceae bacterium]
MCNNGDILEAQEPVFRLLQNPATHAGCAVRRVDTHISSVFLAGERAYKVKRAVCFSFLDFKTLDKRKAACDAEVEVNKAFAPALYRRVVPITREPDGSLALGGSGTPIEWAVEMQRFDENRTLDRLADTGNIDTRLADALGQAVADAHQAVPVMEGEPWIKALASFIEQNDKELRDSPDLFSFTEIAALHAASRALLDRLRPLLLDRGHAGLVRRCHGDLHLGNIVMLGDRPVLFDAIEFDPQIAAGDVLYDLAFLLMDLVYRGQLQNANIVLNRYLVVAGRVEDLDALAALPLFLSVRAAIRAKVTAARRRFVEPSAQPSLAQSARTYFELGCRLVKPPPARLVAVGGLSGTGKSALARSLAAGLPPIPGAVVLRSDVERKALFGRTETERLPPEAYSTGVSARIYATLQRKAERIIAAGHSAIIDAVFARPAERDSVRDIARSRGVRFHGLFLIAPLETRLARVGMRGPDASDADARIAQAQESYDLGHLEWSLIDAAGTPQETLRRSMAAIDGRV